ncbi:MAG TPA: response regulator transcription factor [Spirochaetota bacterium]|nr:response regulator transcription factor [Spirochaetota bacterium]HPI90497.1 response regulator transcription factor [Spirochaetota bacterium]HPR46941.1 response regulator transcription factor [Spirochaetota bacterium]
MKITVSIVEDHEKTAAELSNIIRQSNDFEFLEWYPSGEAACKGIPENLPDLVIMDIGLPGMDGIECISRLRENVSGLKIVVLTIFEDQNNIVRAIESGANGYLLKDIEPSLLLAELMVMHLGGGPMSPSVARKIINRYRLDGIITSKKEAEPLLQNSEHDSGFQDLISKRELEILNLVSLGFVYTDISDELNISPHTVRRHIENIYKKMNVHSRSEAIIKGRRFGLFDRPKQ